MSKDGFFEFQKEEEEEDTKVSFGGFTYYSEQRKCNINIPANLKHILVFGQSRQGKSSVINLMTGKNKKNGASVSDKVKGNTFSTEPWFNNEYCFWDTAGLNEQENGTVINADATKNLIKFVKESKGFHGAIMVVSWNNINSGTTKRNWDLFYGVFLDERIPIIICITGRGIESAENDQDWLNRQQKYIASLGYVSKIGKPLKCVVYSKDLSEVTEMLLPYYEKYRARSKTFIEKLLATNVNDKFYNPIADRDWFDVFTMVINTVLKFMGLKKFMIVVRDGFKELLIKLGFSDEEAQEIASETY